MPPITEDQKVAAASFFDDLDKDQIFPKNIEEEETIPKKEDEKPKSEETPPKKEEDEEQVPKFKREEKAKSKDESIADLRKQRDEYREEIKKRNEVLGDHKPEAIKPLLDFILEEADGPITPEYVTEKLAEIKSQKEEIDRLGKELEARERVVTDLDIRSSTEFRNGFQVPYEQAMETLFLEFATVSPDKKIIAPKATAAFNEFLTTNPDADGITVKQKLLDFKKAFTEEAGEDPILPTISSLMTSLRAFNSKRESLRDAYTNWKTKKAEEAKRQEASSQIQTEAQKKANKKLRVELASKAFREFNLDEIPFVTTAEAEELFKEEFQFGEKLYEGKDIPEWDKLVQRGVNARLWDKYKSRIVELIELEKSVLEGERNNIPGKGQRRGSDEQSKNKTDWLKVE